MTNYLAEAEAIYDEYKSRSRSMALPFQDAVIAFLWLIARLMISKKTK